MTPLTAGANKKVAVRSGDLDAYSAYLQFASLRAHIAGQQCTTASDCQAGQSCATNVCTPR